MWAGKFDKARCVRSGRLLLYAAAGRADRARTIFDRASSSAISAIFRAQPPATAAFH